MTQIGIPGISPHAETLEDLQKALRYWRRFHDANPESYTAAPKIIDLEKKIRALNGELSPIAAGDIRRALENRYDGPGWAVMHEVQSRPGYAPSRRGATLRRELGMPTGESKRFLDTVVVGLWPSHNFDIIGIEIKVSRGDWLREIKDMTKSAAFIARCSKFYVAAPASAVKPAELPDGWGWMRFSRTRRGDSLRIAKKCLDREPTLDRAFLASLLQRQGNPK